LDVEQGMLFVIDGSKGLKPPSPSRSSTTYSVTVNFTVTHQPRRPKQPSLCNHDTRTAATLNFHGDWGNLWKSSHPVCVRSGHCFAAVAATRWAGAGQLLLAESGHRGRPIGAIAFGIQTVGAARSLSHASDDGVGAALTIASVGTPTSALRRSGDHADAGGRSRRVIAPLTKHSRGAFGGDAHRIADVAQVAL
jgi:hypothetical protein